MYKDKKQQLEKLEIVLSERLTNLKKDLSQAHSSDSGEQAVERENDEVIEALVAEAEDELGQIKQAIKRINKGNYGVCQECGKTINPKRLEAMPYSVLCIQCAEKNTIV
jgi:RNA polymerase-binding protein DksA